MTVDDPRCPAATNEPARTDRRPPPRVGFLTPSLLMGGAERWMIALAEHCDPEAVAWAGTALTADALAEPAICREMNRFMPVYGGPAPDGDRSHPYVTRLPTAADAVTAVARQADVIISWGVHYLKDQLDGFPGASVLVSHGTGEWTNDAMKASESGATHFAAVSEAALAPFSPSARSKARVIHNGVDADRCTPTIGRDRLRALWGFDELKRLVGYVGRYSPEKNPLAAARAVRELGGDYRAVYIGSGWKEAETRAGVVEAAGDRAVFFPPVPRVGDVFVALDVLVLASPSEGFSLGLTEAWLAGLPTVATRVGAVPELEREYGPLVVPVPVDPTPRELADAVETALGPDRRVRTERARRVAWDHFTAGAMAARWTEFLREVCR